MKEQRQSFMSALAETVGMSEEEWLTHLAASRQESRNECHHQVDALLEAGWDWELPFEDAEPWQWRWRRPGPRGGRLFLSTNQAFNALQRQS